MERPPLSPTKGGGRGSPDPKGLVGIPPPEETGVGHDNFVAIVAGS